MSVTKLISSSSNSKISCKFISKFIEKVDYTPVSLLDKGKKEWENKRWSYNFHKQKLIKNLILE